VTDDSRIDLSALDPGADPSRLDRSARAIASRVAPSLRRRRERVPALWIELAEWRRPVLAAAALVAAASIIVLAQPPSTAVFMAGPGPATLAEAAGVPPVAASWVESGLPPSNEALLDTQEAP
jgi:anti-sigma-K factor RskA